MSVPSYSSLAAIELERVHEGRFWRSVILAPVKGLALTVLDDDVIIKADGGLSLGASIMAVGRGKRFVA